jgi:hypothetical protein
MTSTGYGRINNGKHHFGRRTVSAGRHHHPGRSHDRQLADLDPHVLGRPQDAIYVAAGPDDVVCHRRTLDQVVGDLP